MAATYFIEDLEVFQQ